MDLAQQPTIPPLSPARHASAIGLKIRRASTIGLTRRKPVRVRSCQNRTRQIAAQSDHGRGRRYYRQCDAGSRISGRHLAELARRLIGFHSTSVFGDLTAPPCKAICGAEWISEFQSLAIPDGAVPARRNADLSTVIAWRFTFSPYRIGFQL